MQYVDYLGHAARLDFGDSYRLGRPAMAEVLERLPVTAELMLASTLIAVVLGLILGLLAGGRPGSAVDRVVSAAAIALQSFPTFWIGIMLILVFALALRMLPSAGSGTPQHLILPAITMALPFTAIVARLTRTSVAETHARAVHPDRQVQGAHRTAGAARPRAAQLAASRWSRSSACTWAA